MLSRYCYCFFLLGLSAFTVRAQQADPLRSSDFELQQKWVDSIYQTLSLEEKLGQLFMISVFSREKNFSEVEQKIKKYDIGGIIFSKGGPKRQAKLTNQFQSISKVPLLIGMDAEWGLAMRLDSTFAYPWNMTLGAIKNTQLVEKVGERIASHCKALGVQIDFAPDADINTNPDNPIIGNRSFGEDVSNVSEKSVAFIRGMQRGGVLANAKHFPGHGDTHQDSHKTLPLILHSKERIEKLELQPFQAAISSGVASVMVGHLNIPSLEPNLGLPSSLSHAVITDLLKNQIGFNGLIFTDALGMKGVADYASENETVVEAFLAGNDMLLMPDDLERSVQAMLKAYHLGKITPERLEYSVKKILKAKYWVGLHQSSLIRSIDLEQRLHTFEDDLLLEQLAENALTVIKNENALLPIRRVGKGALAYVSLGREKGGEFYQTMRRYCDIPQLKFSSEQELLKKADQYETLIVGVHQPDKTPWDRYQLTEQEQSLLRRLSERKNVILVVFTSPYALRKVDVSKVSSIVIAYQNHKVFQQKAAQLLFGAIEGRGVLPVSISDEFPVNTSISTPLMGRLSYGLPPRESIARALSRIDSLAQVSIRERMTPGMQVWVAYKGKVIYQKNFGTLDYNPKNPVTDTTLYDLASLTKIMASLPSMMYLYDHKRYSLDNRMVQLLPWLKGTNKANLRLRNVLAHYAGFQSWIPFYKSTLDESGNPSPQIYRTQKSDEFPYQVAKNLYIQKNYPNEMLALIARSDLLKKKRYLYSDLPFYLLQKYIESEQKKTISDEVYYRFYEPMGIYRMRYLPLRYFPVNQIAPTEEDNYFRHQRLQGYVHDMGAAMLGGVAGHAGLFADANSVGQMMQMYLQKGYYGGVQYVSAQTLDTFNTCVFCKDKVRRGLIFDKPQLEKEGPTCGCVPMSSFGHTGFTGTYAWADPQNELVYVFLSNRTYPSAENRKLIQQGIRTKIQEIIYQAIEKER